MTSNKMVDKKKNIFWYRFSLPVVWCEPYGSERLALALETSTEWLKFFNSQKHIFGGF